MPRELARAVLVVCGFLVGTLAVADIEDAVPIAQAARGRIPFDAEVRVDVGGFAGHLDIRVGRTDELLFGAVLENDRARELPVVVSTDGQAFFVRPSEGFEAERIELQIVVPAGTGVDIEASESTGSISGTAGAVTLRGNALETTLRTIESLDAEIEGGALALNGVAGDVVLKGVDLTVTGGGIEGDLRVSVERSEADLERVSGRMSGSLEDSEWAIADVRGGMELEVGGGGLDVAELLKGGVFRMDGAYLRVTQSSGEIDVQTDDELVLEDNEAAVHVDSFGGSVGAVRQTGLIEIVTDGTTVQLEEISGPLRVKGERLKLGMTGVSGETILILRNSEVTADGISAPLEIYNEFGDLRLANVSEDAKLETRDGSIYLEAVSGPLQIDADGETVEVGWTSISREKDTRIANAGGDVVLYIPRQGGGSFRAVTKYGRIESTRGDIKIDPEGTRAVGILNRQRVPTLTVECEGDVRIEDARSGGG